MRIAVTGASGFVGGAVVADALARGHDVLALSRRPIDLERHPASGGGGGDGSRGTGRLEWRCWDVAAGPLPGAPRVDAVVHAAARVGELGSAAQFAAANVVGTGHVLRSFPGARFVYISSASVYDPFVPTVMGREVEAPVARYLGRYAASKAAAERLLSARGPALARGVVILRPHAVYGPGDTTLLPRIEAAVRGRRLVIAGDGSVRQSLTHIDNLLAAVRAAIRLDDGAFPSQVPDDGAFPSQVPDDGAFGTDLGEVGAVAAGATVPRPSEAGVLVVNVADAEPVLLRDALLDVLARRGRPDVAIFGVPLRVADGIARAAEVAAWVRPWEARREPRLSRYAISHLALERTLDLTVLRARLGVEPAPTSFAGAHGWSSASRGAFRG